MKRIRLDKRNFRHWIDAESTPDGDGIFCLVRFMAPCLKLHESRPVFGFVAYGADEIAQSDAVRLARLEGEFLRLAALHGTDGFMRAVRKDDVGGLPVGVMFLLLAGIVRAEDKRDAVDDDGAAEIDDEFGIVMLPVTP